MKSYNFPKRHRLTSISQLSNYSATICEQYGFCLCCSYECGQVDVFAFVSDKKRVERWLERNKYSHDSNSVIHYFAIAGVDLI